jgi:hypothetical protein
MLCGRGGINNLDSSQARDGRGCREGRAGTPEAPAPPLALDERKRDASEYHEENQRPENGEGDDADLAHVVLWGPDVFHVRVSLVSDYRRNGIA